MFNCLKEGCSCCEGHFSQMNVLPVPPRNCRCPPAAPQGPQLGHAPIQGPVTNTSPLCSHSSTSLGSHLHTLLGHEQQEQDRPHVLVVLRSSGEPEALPHPSTA